MHTALNGRGPDPHPAEPRIGCSGWNYRHWRGRFYPDDLPTSRWLARYAETFDTVEVNNTFYRLPEVSTFARWSKEAPATFVFALKASRYLTHLKRLREPAEPLARLIERAAPLRAQLGPMLFQLPGNFARDDLRLHAFLQALPRTLGREAEASLSHTIEFRHPSWYCKEIFALLREHEVALCAHDMAGSAIDDVSVGPFTYVRFHGAGGRYFGSYDDVALTRWAERLVCEWRGGRRVYAYFNNDPDAVAPHDAQRLRALVRSQLAIRR